MAQDIGSHVLLYGKNRHPGKVGTFLCNKNTAFKTKETVGYNLMSQTLSQRLFRLRSSRTPILNIASGFRDYFL